MCAWRWPITVLLSAVVSVAPAPSSLSQRSSLSPTISSPLAPFTPLPGSDHAEPSQHAHCPLKISASSRAVRFGDSFTANCSVHSTEFFGLGWEVAQEPTRITTETFLVWSVNMTKWNISATCFALSDQGGQCQISLPLTVYKLPENVSIDFVNHTGPLLEAHQYTLQCVVQDVAPVNNVKVTFYKGQKPLGSLQSTQHRRYKLPSTELFTLDIIPDKEDDLAEYWCEATLELEATGEQHPLAVSSQTVTATVLFGPQLECPTKLQVREGETFSCEVRGNPKPLVTWYRDGRAVLLPAHSSREHAGTYTVLAMGYQVQKNFTVEVEVITHNGTMSYTSRHFMLAVLLLQIFTWL